MSEIVVVCVSEPEVAVTVTVEVPAGTGLGFVEPFLDPLHPLRKTRMNSTDKVPPPMESNLKIFLRFRSSDHMAVKPNGSIAPPRPNHLPERVAVVKRS